RPPQRVGRDVDFEHPREKLAPNEGRGRAQRAQRCLPTVLPCCRVRSARAVGYSEGATKCRMDMRMTLFRAKQAFVVGALSLPCVACNRGPGGADAGDAGLESLGGGTASSGMSGSGEA